MAAIKEHVSILGDTFDYVNRCQELGRSMGSAQPAIPEPDWLSEETNQWLDIIDATGVEERHRTATQQVTTSLREHCDRTKAGEQLQA